MHRNTRNTLATLIAALFTLPAQAQDIPLLEDIVVTATRTPRSLEESQTTTTVITRQDIERSQASSVQEALAGLAGINLSNQGGAGMASSIFLRGANAEHTVLLIDGVKTGSATLGLASFQDFPLNLIERIEVVRGPLSSLYGSEAIGGVIQLFTRKGSGDFKPAASVTLGARNTRQASANLSGGSKQSWLNLGASHFDTDGYSACKGSLSAACYTLEPDKDGYRNIAFNLNGGYRFQPDSVLEANFLRAEGKVQFDGSYENQSDSVQQVIGLNLKHRINDLWRFTLSAGQSKDDYEGKLNGVATSAFDTQRNSYSWQNDLALASGHLLTLGLDRLEDTVGGSTAYSVDKREDTGAFMQYQAKLAGYDLKLSLRQDDDSQFGHHTTGNLGLSHELSAKLRASLRYGTAFKAPSFNQLYWPMYGNPDLQPEKSRSFEAGLNGRLANGLWSINLFDTEVTDLIALDPNWLPANINQAHLRGVEVVTSMRLGQWEARLNVTLQNPEQSGGVNDGKWLNRRAKQSARIDLDRSSGKWQMGGVIRAESQRYDDLANTVDLPGYALFDLRTAYPINSDWQLSARLENLFDKDYETAYGYSQPGRGLFVTLRYQPQK